MEALTPWHLSVGTLRRGLTQEVCLSIETFSSFRYQGESADPPASENVASARTLKRTFLVSPPKTALTSPSLALLTDSAMIFRFLSRRPNHAMRLSRTICPVLLNGIPLCFSLNSSVRAFRDSFATDST